MAKKKKKEEADLFADADEIQEQIEQKKQSIPKEFLIEKKPKPASVEASPKDWDFVSLCALGMSPEEAYIRVFEERDKFKAIANGNELYKRYDRIIKEEKKDIAQSGKDMHPILYDAYRNIKILAHSSDSQPGVKMRAWENIIKVFYTGLLSYDSRFRGSPLSPVKEIESKVIEKDFSKMTDEEIQSEIEKELEGGK